MLLETISRLSDCDIGNLRNEAVHVHLQVAATVLHNDAGTIGSSWLRSVPEFLQHYRRLLCFQQKSATEALTTSVCIKPHGATVEVEVLTPMSWSNNSSSNLILYI